MYQMNNISVSPRRGLSLVEIMIAMVMTLIVLGAMMAAFSYGSAEMQKGRASIELNNRLIAAEEQLRRDLSRITVDLKPHHELPSLPKGYVEIVDGPQVDYVSGYDVVLAHGGNEMVFGDRDDYFACTIKSDGKAFRGRYLNDIAESHLAEVVWFTVFDASTTDPNDVLLIRRQLLILPTPPAAALFTTTAAALSDREAAVSDFISRTDISVRVVRTAANYAVFANSLSDLALRGNRFSHTGSLQSLVDDPHRAPMDCLLEILQLGNRYGDNHVMASQVAAFDLKVFDPNAVNLFVSNAGNTEIFDIAEPGSIAFEKGSFANDNDGVAEPEDSVFDVADPNAALMQGAYVDLGKAPGGVFGAASSGHVFGYNPSSGILGTAFIGYANGFHPNSGEFTPTAAQIAGMVLYQTFDTGTSQYNRRVANHPGSNGVDDDGDGIVDGPNESLTINIAPPSATAPVNVAYQTVSAPYNAPIRGLKFTMRVLEPNTKQVRQLTVKKSFVAQ